jgi:hypothetical protein
MLRGWEQGAGRADGEKSLIALDNFVTAIYDGEDEPSIPCDLYGLEILWSPAPDTRAIIM